MRNQTGPRLPHRQLGFLGAALSIGGAVLGAISAKKKAKQEKKLAQQAVEAADPFAPYRKDNAQKLQNLMNDPSSVENLPEYKTRIRAAERTMAAQGFTGSGNALVAAAEASGEAYQSAFNNLALTSGANANPGQGFPAALQSTANANQTDLNGQGNLFGTIARGGQQIWDSFNSPPPTGP